MAGAAPETRQEPNQVVFTNKARCRDCYRCVRVCPVKAIRMQDGQARVDAERCLACGTCIRECPQHAKQYRTDLDRAIKLVGGTRPVAVSIAPSFAAAFTDWERRRLPSALRRLGFAFVAETAVGAYQVARKQADYVRAHPGEAHICTACPAVVSLVEKYHPDLVDRLIPVLSPMMAHARHLKERLPDSRVVFIGPCVAKKAEADRPELAGLVDCVLTFEELREWLEREAIGLAACEESGFDEEPTGAARFFPVVGGSIRTSELSTDILDLTIISVSGIAEISEVLAGLRQEPRAVLIEPLFCLQGCVNGPALPTEQRVYGRREDLLRYAAEAGGAPPDDTPMPALQSTFAAQEVNEPSEVTEEKIRHVLSLTGKVAPEDELNCGACGYESCRAKAEAVIRGMAEPEMCIPYMKRLAEQRSDLIIETSPNGIVMVDERLTIISMNPAFRAFFMATDAVLGKPISYLMDPDPFEKVAAGGQQMVELTARHDRYKIVCHEIIYALPKERQYVGIFVNITRSQHNQERLDELRSQTLSQARDLLEHQISMAQRIAQFLGESTAQGEQLVDKLVQMTGKDQEESDEGGPGWLWDTYTSR